MKINAETADYRDLCENCETVYDQVHMYEIKAECCGSLRLCCNCLSDLRKALNTMDA